jgi:hypothetical protein
MAKASLWLAMPVDLASALFLSVLSAVSMNYSNLDSRFLIRTVIYPSRTAIKNAGMLVAAGQIISAIIKEFLTPDVSHHSIPIA